MLDQSETYCVYSLLPASLRHAQGALVKLMFLNICIVLPLLTKQDAGTRR